MAADPTPYLLAEAAESLAATARDLRAHIERRANEIAQEQIAIVAEDAERRIAELRRADAAWEQRFNDLRAELQRQLAAQVKQNERLNREVKETRAAVRRVEDLKVWTNEDGKRFVFADGLWEALAEAGPLRHLTVPTEPTTDDRATR